VAFIVPARSHPEVIVAAVAARDKKRAEEHAKLYDIPIVHENYDGKLFSPPWIALPSCICHVIKLTHKYHSTHQ
jgi:predicted dehydrogenase